MFKFPTTAAFIVALSLGLAAGAQAQDQKDKPETPAAKPAAEQPLSLGKEEIGSAYVREEFGAWQLRCVHAPEGKTDPCELYQLLKDENDNSVAEISIFALPDGQQAAAGATVITPLETLLTQQVRLAIDGGAVKRYPFAWCSRVGCVARLGFTPEEVATMKSGATAVLSIVPVGAPDSSVDLNISLKGFTAGLEASKAALAAAQE